MSDPEYYKKDPGAMKRALDRAREAQDEIEIEVLAGSGCDLQIAPAPLVVPAYPGGVLNAALDPELPPGFQATLEVATRGGWVVELFANTGEGEQALSSHLDEVSKRLLSEVQDRLGKAGVQVLETRISHLAYAPEIASAMLQRQQASAIIAARRKIVEGAVGMVENALELLAEKRVVELDPERRAAMVSNLLVVLCSERGTTPVVNTGTLYQ